MWSYVGLAVALCAIAYAAVIVGRTLLFGVDVPGYASLMTLILLLGALNLISIGILGEYIGRIAIEVRQRPLYVVRDTLRSEEHTSELQSLMRSSYAVFRLTKKLKYHQ